MLQNAYLLAKIGADTAENEQHFAEARAHHGLREDGALRALLPDFGGLLLRKSPAKFAGPPANLCSLVRNTRNFKRNTRTRSGFTRNSFSAVSTPIFASK